jgi:hypothetical protein
MYVVSEPFASNGCFSGPTVFALSKYDTVFKTNFHALSNFVLIVKRN